MEDRLLNRANVLMALLAQEKNVLLSGAPATGKTTLLNIVEKLFLERGETTVDPNGPAAFPQSAGKDESHFPGGSCTYRRVFRTTFHQGTKYRDFVRGLIPSVGADTVSFKVSKGLLYQAAEFAKEPDSAALVIIDEINRGPAVSIFGDMISAFEADKRLDKDGKAVPGKTVTVQILDDDAELVGYQLPDRLYILAAMNQADSSVEPMDAAFIRRWRQEKLRPSSDDLVEYFMIDFPRPSYPEAPDSAADVYALATAAWEAINAKIAIGRGEDYQIGQGVLMRVDSSDLPKTTEGALQYVASCWPIIAAHIDEVFFGDKEAIAEVLNVSQNSFFELASTTFAGRQVISIKQREPICSENIYQALLSLIG